jgi:hypothetical protein
VQDFAEPEAAEQVLRPKRMMRLMEPAVLVTDMIGTIPLGSSFVETVRKELPLMKIILFSRSATPKDAFKLAFLRRVIDDYQSKADHKKISESVFQWFNTYTRQASLARLRNYIARCPDPKTPFFPDGAGKHLTIIDAYWEIVRQTELGQELLSAWDAIMDDWYQPQPFQRRDSHAERSRRLSYVA